MNSVWTHRGVVALLALLVVLAAGLLPPSGAQAAVGSSYSYIVDGEELAVGYDPLSLQAGLLLPEDLFRTLEIQVRQGAAGSVSLTRGSLQVSAKVGDRQVIANGERVTLAAAPIRANGQLYLPDGVLVHLGVEIAVETGLLLIDRLPLVEPTADNPSEYAALLQASTLRTHLDTANREALTTTLTYLDPKIVAYKSWTDDPTLRGRVLKMLESGAVLLEVGLFNENTNFYQFQSSGLVIVDNLGNQYASTGEIIPIQGDISAQLAPTAKARGIMVYPALKSGAKSFKIYATSNKWPVGAFDVK